MPLCGGHLGELDASGSPFLFQIFDLNTLSHCTIVSSFYSGAMSNPTNSPSPKSLYTPDNLQNCFPVFLTLNIPDAGDLLQIFQ